MSAKKSTNARRTFEAYISPATAYIIVQEGKIVDTILSLEEVDDFRIEGKYEIIPCTAELLYFYEERDWLTRNDGVADLDRDMDDPDQPEFEQAGWVAATSEGETYGAKKTLKAIQKLIAKYDYPIAILPCDAAILEEGDAAPSVNVWPGGFATFNEDDEWNFDEGGSDHD